MSPARSPFAARFETFGLNNDRTIFFSGTFYVGHIVVALVRNLILTDENIKIYRHKLNLKNLFVE
jgi:hypothetical protein